MTPLLRRWINLAVLILLAQMRTALGGDDDSRIDAQVCGLNSLGLAASYVNGVSAEQIHAHLNPAHAPYSLRDLNYAAHRVGLRTALLHWADKRQARFDCPAILHVRGRPSSTTPDHFITCFGAQNDFVCVGDYPNPPRLVLREQLFSVWDGDALYVDAPEGDRIAMLRRPSQQKFVRRLVGGLSVISLAFLVANWICRLRWVPYQAT